MKPIFKSRLTASFLACTLAAAPLSPAAHAQRNITKPPVIAAAESGELEKLRGLLADPAQALVRDTDGNTALIKVLSNNSASFKDMGAMVELLMNSGADVKAVNRQGLYPLRQAAVSYHKDVPAIITLLLARGADVRSMGPGGNSVLHGIIQAEAVRLLTAAGANPNATNDNGQTPLHLAASQSREAVVALLKAGAKPNLQDYNGNTPLLAALGSSYQSYAVDLIGPSDLTLRGSRGMSALQLALAEEGEEILLPILKQEPAMSPLEKAFAAVARQDLTALKANLDAAPHLLNSRLSSGTTLLHFASRTANPVAARELLARRANPNARDEKGRTPLHYTYTNSSNPEQVKKVMELLTLLTGAGGEVNSASRDGLLPLHIAISSGSPELVALLLQAGADPNFGDRRNRTGLQMAVEVYPVPKAREIAQLLLDKGADINARGGRGPFGDNADGLTVLAQCVSRSGSDAGKSEVLVPFLLDKGARLSPTDDNGNTVLHLAGNSTPAVKTVLLGKTATDLKEALLIKNRKGLTPLGQALASKHTGWAEQLRAAGATE